MFLSPLTPVLALMEGTKKKQTAASKKIRKQNTTLRQSPQQLHRPLMIRQGSGNTDTQQSGDSTSGSTSSTPCCSFEQRMKRTLVLRDSIMGMEVTTTASSTRRASQEISELY